MPRKRQKTERRKSISREASSDAPKHKPTEAGSPLLADALYENIFANVSVITAHHPITIANDVPIFTLPVVANPIAVSARVQNRKISICDAMKYQNGLSAAFMKYPGLDATGLFKVNPSALTPART